MQSDVRRAGNQIHQVKGSSEVKQKKVIRSLVRGALGGFMIFVLLCVGLKLGWWDTLDRSAAEAMPELHSDSVVDVFALLSELGSTKAYGLVFVLVGGYLLFRKRIAAAIAIFVSTLGAYALNTLLKNMFSRERPPLEHLVEADGFSFPSGNAMVAAAFYGMIAYLLWRSGARGAGWGVTLLLVLLGVIGFSRVYLNVHYPTDILAGYAAGAMWMLICCVGYEKFRKQ